MLRTIQLIIIGILIMLFPSCYNAKKATQQVNKANDNYPEVVAKIARDKYPCTDLLKPDTLITYKDSLVLVEIECPELIEPTTVVKIDTVNNVITKTIRVPVNMPIQTRTVTKWFEDSAKLKLYDVALNKANTANEKLQATVIAQDKKIAHKTKENWIWRIIAICLICWQVWKIYRRITKII